MSTNTDPPAGDPGNPPAGDPGAGKGGDPPGSKGVPLETHRQLLDEKKKVEQKARELEEKLAQRERDDAEKAGDLKKLLELEKKRADEAEARAKAHDEQERNRRKLAAVLGGLDGTVDPKFYGLIDFEKVVFDDQGNVNQLSVREVVETVNKNYPEIVKKKGGPQTPAAAPTGGVPQTGTIKHSDWLKLSSKDKAKWKPDQVVDG